MTDRIRDRNGIIHNVHSRDATHVYCYMFGNDDRVLCGFSLKNVTPVETRWFNVYRRCDGTTNVGNPYKSREAADIAVAVKRGTTLNSRIKVTLK